MNAIPVGNFLQAGLATDFATMKPPRLSNATERAARFEHRRLRFIELIETLTADGTPRAWVATAVSKSDSYLARLMLPADDKNHRNLGDDLMTAFTNRLNLLPGWFDLPLGSSLPTTTKIGRNGSVTTPDGIRPAPAHTALPFERQLVERIIDLPERWLGRVEQAMLSVLRDYEQQAADDDGRPPDSPSPEKPKRPGNVSRIKPKGTGGDP